MAPFWKKTGGGVEPQGASAQSAPTGLKKQQQQPIELGTIEYCNITQDGRHGDYDAAIAAATESGKPLFANFVEWSG